MVIAIDLDGMLLSFPEFFQHFFRAMKADHNDIGILTARPQHDRDTNIKLLERIGIVPDFFITKPADFSQSNGVFKALVCNELGVDLLFDDFETNDPKMLADFFSINTKTVPFTSWAYRPDEIVAKLST